MTTLWMVLFLALGILLKPAPVRAGDAAAPADDANAQEAVLQEDEKANNEDNEQWNDEDWDTASQEPAVEETTKAPTQ